MATLETTKLYYDRPNDYSNSSHWIERGPKTIAIYESIAYPEGGGQLGDQGVVVQGDLRKPFVDTQKHGGQQSTEPRFQSIKVGSEVRLTLDGDANVFDPDLPVTIEIDRKRRDQLTRSHTAAHLLYLAILDLKPEAKDAVRGCYISPEGGRFDFADQRFTAENIAHCLDFSDRWVNADHPIQVIALERESECRIWVCNGKEIPCGGTHLPSTGGVGSLQLKRKSKGRGIERIYYTLIDL